MYLGEHVKFVGADISPTIKDKIGIISKVRDVTDGEGNVIQRKYRVYVPGHPIVDWLDATDIEKID